ncbi:uncharacterized protein ths isoform X2 [Drosophila bipectinata]|uniref:uncharacterized protein ths isoform X2 n=1 Tax=Drosophila bipectinata TaxID=42026 RepID=UPI001C8A20C9|nr:myb-like protein AA isoform X1 [Drosophila bipectinata]
MLPQLTVYAKIIYLLMVVISGALCTVEDYVIMSLCAQDKAIHLAAEGTVSVTDTSQIQNITILGFPDYLNQEFTFKLALYAKETQRYLCFNDNWRLVGMTKLRDTCYFNETIHHGYFVFRSIVDSERRVGFTHGGKPVGPKMSVKDACYHFNKIDVETFYRQHRHLNSNGNSGNSNSNSNGSSNSNSKSRKPPRNNKNNRHKSNNQNQKLQQQQEHHGHNNNNVILNNNSSNSLSRTNKKQQSKQQQQQQQHQHQVRHHHNDPSLLARRQQHERKQKRRKQQKQQQHQQQQQQRVTASPTKPATATTPVATSPATATTAATLSSKRKGRRRKGKSRQPKLQRQQQQQLAPAATATTAYTDDSFYSSSIGSSTGFEDLDPYNVSSSSSTSLDPWSTWSTIDSFSSSSNSGSSSSSSTTTTSDDSISSSSNYDLWATMITKMEAEASETTSELSGNDTDLLLHYEPQMVEDTGVQEEAESTATYETKATSAIAAIAATAATTTSTTGQQLVIEQTPLQQEMARRISTPAATATSMTTSAATAKATTTPTATTSQTETTRSTQNQGQNEVKPPQRQHKFLVSRQPSATTRVHHLSSTAETLATTPQQQQKQPSSLFSIYKNINSDLNNSLTEASPTATATTGATSTVTVATTTKKNLRKFTRKLMATPYHQLTYVRNEAGDIDIDNLDNISVYPDLYDGDLEGNGNGSSNSTDINRQMPVSLSSYLPTTTTSVLTEFIRIGKNKIDRALKRSQMQKHRRFA